VAAKITRIPRGAAQRAGVVAQRLEAEYPKAECALDHHSALELLVATVLSAQTTDERVNMVTPSLFARYPDAFAYAGANPAEVEQIIRSTGFFRSKTKSIIALGQALVARFDGVVPDKMEELVTLPGVGRKTANVVLGVWFGVPGFPVDTHVTRLTRLLKLTSNSDPVHIESDICAMVAPERWTELSLRLILHGRRVCIARRPQCQVCVLSDICPSSTAAAGSTGSKRVSRL
jgi:endonuclease III